MRFKVDRPARQQSENTATLPYRGKRSGGVTEDRISIRPDVTTNRYDVRRQNGSAAEIAGV
ncbi:hypothetical protein SAMN04488523_12316 [Sulfitobacter brevis]|uniref:Uncharacterized protein n=1 Tax=Sulfitobacter brevis TaxID=74348 RepID=A0A1I2GGD8_9RHOB|nr:hypothetical protein SAMN04488523_12316 [Sulfitobacter brevis]